MQRPVAPLPYPSSAMNPELLPTEADWRTQLAETQVHCAQVEAELAAARSRIEALEEQLQAANSSSQRHYNQLMALVQNIRLGLMLVDDDSHIRFVNQHFMDLFSLTSDSLPADPDAIIPYEAVDIDSAFADSAAFAARAQELHQAGQTVLHELFTLADNRIVELDYLVLDDMQAGRLICYRDVTERFQRDGQLQAMSYLSDHNPNPILRLSATGEPIYANPAAVPVLDALMNDARTELRHHLLSLVRAALRRPVQHQQTLAVAGQYYVFTAVAMPGQSHATLYLTNITARQQAEQRLAEQRRFYETILNQIPMAVAVFDAEHRYLFVNPTVEPDATVRAWMLGRTDEEASRQRKRTRATLRQRRTAFARALRERREVTWEETRRSEQEPRHMLRSFRPVTGPNGDLQMVISTGVDITERKRVEERAARQQEFYESILNLLPVDVAVFDPEHRFLFVNPSSVADPALRRQLIGLSDAEYFALRPQQPAQLVTQRQQYFELAVRTGTDVTWEEMRPGPRPKLILRYLRPVFNADGSLRMVVGSGIDITARYIAEQLQRQVQQQLEEQQAFIRQIVDTLPNVLYVVDADDKVSFTNRSYDLMAVQSQHWQPDGGVTINVHNEMWHMHTLNQQVRNTQQPLMHEMPFTLKTGQTMYYQVQKQPMLQADGRFSILTISTNVTAIKQARMALERREKQYHDLVYYSQALICTHDLQGRLLSVNPAIERLMGAPAAKLVGHHLAESVMPQHHVSMQAYLDGTLPASSEPRVVAIRTAKGEVRYLHYYTYRVEEEGYPPYIVASGYDVTVGIQAQQALQKAKQEAEENARAKESFLARMSHEIRTPLNGVLGMASLLEKTGLTTTQLEYLHTMQHAGQHLLALINDVLDMAKITTNHLELHHAPFDLALALHGAGQTVAALAEQKGLQFHVEPLAANCPRVLGDAYRLHQVLLNLLSNAIKFTEQGSVRLSAEVLRDTAQELTVCFRVRDTGIGIPAEQQTHIFDAFAQASAETSRRFGGTGLGLAISRQLVSQMGGVLRLSSEVGVGTTFSFQLTLPQAPETESNEHKTLASSISCESLRGLRVLLAEDNLVNQLIAKSVLELWGVQVQAVSNGTDALAELSTKHYDAAILDIRMPGLNGVEVTTALRQLPDPARASIPVIALTANAFENDRATYLAAGMNACLTKPYEEADLCELLVQLTQPPRLREAQ
jgi:PAS domain S-box-containing protein